jgi:hypothetical protein
VSASYQIDGFRSAVQSWRPYFPQAENSRHDLCLGLRPLECQHAWRNTVEVVLKGYQLQHGLLLGGCYARHRKWPQTRRNEGDLHVSALQAEV